MRSFQNVTNDYRALMERGHDTKEVFIAVFHDLQALAAEMDQQVQDGVMTKKEYKNRVRSINTLTHIKI